MCIRTCVTSVIVMAAAMLQTCVLPAQIFRQGAQGPALGFVFSAEAVGDFNNNGLPDVVFLDPSGYGLLLDPGVATGSSLATLLPLIGPTTLPNGLTSGAIGVGHFDGDINLDVIIVTSVATALGDTFILLGNGDGTFQPAVPVPLPPMAFVGGYRRARVARMDADGLSDILLISYPPNGAPTCQIFHNQWPVWIAGAPLAIPAFSFTTGDFDGDGIDELAWVTAGTTAGTVVARARHLSTSTGFGTVQTVTTPGGGTNIQLSTADMDGDGFSDLVAFQVGPSSFAQFSVFICYGTGTGTFLSPSSASVANYANGYPSTPPAVEIADLDRAGDLDLLYWVVPICGAPGCSPSPPYHLSWMSTAGRTYAATGTVLTQPSPGVSVAHLLRDLDLDGDADLLGTTTAGFMTRLDNTAELGGGCSGSTAAGLVSTPGALGSASFVIQVSGAPNAPVVLGLSTQLAPSAACGPQIDLGSTNLILPHGQLGFGATGPGGLFTLSIPLPSVPALAGAYFAQAAVLDPTGPFHLGGASFALTNARTILLF